MKGESGFGSGGEVRVRMAIGPGQWRPLPWAPRFRRPFSGPPQGPLPQESTGLRDLPTQSLCTPFETTPRLPGILEYLLKHAEPASGSVGEMGRCWSKLQFYRMNKSRDLKYSMMTIVNNNTALNTGICQESRFQALSSFKKNGNHVRRWDDMLISLTIVIISLCKSQCFFILPVPLFYYLQYISNPLTRKKKEAYNNKT